MSRRDKRQTGNTMLEFALVMPLLVPMLLWLFQLGMGLGRAIQVKTVNRDAGSMFVRNVDFSQPNSQQILLRLAQGLGMNLSGGNGVVMLSLVMFVGDNECLAGGMQPNSAACPNYQQYVFTKRITIGNSSLRSSSFGTPSAALLQSDGSINTSDYLTDSSCIAVGFGNVLNLAGGEVAYVSETYFASPDYDLPGFSTGTGTYARNFF